MIGEVVFLIVAISSVMGAIIGIVYRGRTASELITSGVVSAMLFVYLQWANGTLSIEWSIEQPFTSLLYLSGPFFFVFFVPTASMALLVGFLRRDKFKKAHK